MLYPELTCNPDNIASIKTIERLGGKLISTESIPESHILYSMGDTETLRFVISAN